jgi:probable phosphoglycerate mutase
MKRVYFVRHGQTNANVNAVWQDHSEKLSVAGELQAIKLAERVQNIDFDEMFISDYVRTQQTAKPILELKPVPFTLSPLLREEKIPTSWVGKDELDERGTEFAENMIEYANNIDWRIEDAENTDDIYNRIEGTLKMLENSTSQNILVVSHGNFLKQLVGYVLLGGQGSKKEVASFKRTFKSTNTGISILVLQDNRWRVLSWNDHAHFAE